MENNEVSKKEFAERNAAKYGDKNDDTIARTYRENPIFGDVYCAKNAEKYLRRFISNSPKAQNITDLDKVIDYVTRMREHHVQKNSIKTEIVE